MEDQWMPVLFREELNLIVAEAKLIICLFRYLSSLSAILVNSTVIFQVC